MTDTVAAMWPHEYDVMARLEDEHWWYQGLRQLTVEHLTRAGVDGDTRCLLDAGCGTGGCYHVLRRRFPAISYVGIDVEPRALDHCRHRGLHTVIQGSVNQIPLRPASTDIVLCLDVLYFASIDPRAALQHFSHALKPGGLLILNLPAFQVLRGRHDRAVGIPQRFRRTQVRELVEQAGFRVIKTTYWNMTLFLPLMLWRWLSRSRRTSKPTSDLLRVPRWLNAMLRGILAVEIWMTRWISLPLGSSVFLVGQKA